MILLSLISLSIASSLDMPAGIRLIDPPDGSGLNRDLIMYDVVSSMSAWEQSCSNVDWSVTDDDAAPVVIDWKARSEFRDSNAWGETVRVNDDTNDLIVGATVYMASDVDWNDPESLDFQSTLTHELGHALGYPHSEYRDDTMFASADPGETNKRTLTSREIDMLCEDYPIDLPCGSRLIAAAFIIVPFRRRV